MMKLKPGSLFANQYEVVRVMSTGGMGIVYEVIHRGTKRKRALKVMLPHVLEDDDMRERFALEAVVTADIESEHLVEIFDAGIDSDTECPYIVMELLRGEDLGKRLSRGDRYTPAEVLAIVEQIARALEKTHERGIVHRDLKPENIFVTHRDDGSPRLKILDFGIAKLVKTTGAGAKNTTRSFGTPFYVPREQLTGESRLIGPASDLYSVAHIVYTMLVGYPYFDDEASVSANVLSLLVAVGNGTKDPASERAKKRGVDLPSGFDAWFARATHLDPRERFRKATELLEGLRATYNDVEPSASIAVRKRADTTDEERERAGAVSATTPASIQDERTPAVGKPPSERAAASGREGPTRDFVSTPSEGPRPAGSSQAFATALPESAARSRAPRRRLWIGISAVGVLAASAIAATQLGKTSAGDRAAQTDAPRSETSASRDALGSPSTTETAAAPVVTQAPGSAPAITVAAPEHAATGSTSATAVAAIPRTSPRGAPPPATPAPPSAKSAAPPPPPASAPAASSAPSRPERIR